MEESSFCYAKGHRRSSTLRYKRLHQDGSLERPFFGAEGAKRVTPSISQAKGQSMHYNYIFNIVLFCIFRGQIIWIWPIIFLIKKGEFL